MSMPLPGDNTLRTSSADTLREVPGGRRGPDNAPKLIPYPMDPRLIQADGRLALSGVEDSSQPLERVTAALDSWNAYLTRHDQRDLAAFLQGIRGLVHNEVASGEELGGWPVRALGAQQAGQDGKPGIAVLSTHMQGLALSALARAYQVSGDDVYRRSAGRVLHTFAHDILDGGIAAPVTDDGFAFEAVGMYPAPHSLSAFLFGITSLYDYGALCTDPAEPEALARGGHNALHALLDAYDTGRWTRADLLGNSLTTLDSQRLCALLLKMVASYAGCDGCRQAAQRWAAYNKSPAKRVQVRVVRARQALERTLWRVSGALCGLAPHRAAERGAPRDTDSPSDSRLGICVTINAYPVSGGMRAVLDGWRMAMSDEWRMEFLAAYIGPDAGDRVIHRFGSNSRHFGLAAYTPFRFPNVLAYVGFGFLGLRRLLRQQPGFSVILPQDGVYSAVFAGMVAKLTGIRCVVVDHGNVRDAFDPAYYAEQRAQMANRQPLHHALGYVRLALYVRTLRWLAKIGARYTSHVLAASDDIVSAYRQHLGVSPVRITRFPHLLDADRFTPPDEVTRAQLRAESGIPANAIVIAMVNRLHPVKGVDIGIAAVERAYDALPAELRARVYVLIVGDGQLREQVAEQVHQSQFFGQTRMWGDATANEVATLLKVSDIFLYSARRDANPVAVVEAMAAGCGIVGTVTSPHIEEYLADDRGILVAKEDIDGLAQGLVTLVSNDSYRRNLGKRARTYVMQHHTVPAVRPYLLRATYWVPSFPGLAAAAERGAMLVVPDGRDRTR